MTMTSPTGSGELPCANPAMRFEPELETEYIRSRLLGGRALIRMACLLALVTTLLRMGELLVTGRGMQIPSVSLMILFPAVVLSSSLLLTWISWSQGFSN